MYMLLKSQRNEIFKIIQEYGLEPANFSWGKEKYRRGSKNIITSDRADVVPSVQKLIYKGRQFYFQFELIEGEYFCKFTPGREKLFEQQSSSAWVH